MNRRLPFMATYTGDDMMTVILPDLAAGSKQIVVITHDKSCTAHDGKEPSGWIKSGSHFGPKVMGEA
ncbi:hypothetical protein BSLG_009915 [Batrachochytrium salamandrivorans]|nr:hypothetical protein BSLG_009915 [Batrachochytrium salamandrivorans]